MAGSLAVFLAGSAGRPGRRPAGGCRRHARRAGSVALVYAPGGARAGPTVMVWTDGSDRLDGAPARPADVTVREEFAATAAAALTTAAVAVTGLLARRVLDRRLAAWSAGWSRTGPQ